MCILACLILVLDALAQGKFSVSGTITDKQGNPLELATMVLNAELRATADVKGKYSLKNVPNGSYTYKVQYVGFKPATGVLKVNGKDVRLDISLEDLNLSIKEVEVTARQQQMGSISKIDQDAIRHIQPKSLSDVLQLVPGNLTQNPNLNNMAQAQIREIGSNSNNALGTSVVVDGTPLSNDANLQAIAPTRNGTNSSTQSDGLNGQTTAGRGTDLRTVSVGNVDYVEVVRGIPSVEYGNLMMLYLIAIVKISDMGGFAAGVSTAKLMKGGNHKMCPTISPNKSWEGLAGSVAASCLLSCCFIPITHFVWYKALAFGVTAALVGTFGDLVESKFKRWVGVKDSSTFMPAGMGGFLDMFDSLLFAPALLAHFV